MREIGLAGGAGGSVLDGKLRTAQIGPISVAISDAASWPFPVSDARLMTCEQS